MNFFKIFFATLLGCIVASVVTAILWFMAAVGLFASFATLGGGELKPNSILVIDLSEPIVDSPSSSLLNSIDMTTYSVKSQITLLDALGLIEYAANDSMIDGIVIAPSILAQISTANLEELRGAIERFKSSGKFVVAYADSYTQSGYYLASVADEVYLNPEGVIDWRGVASNTLFYKGLFDKLDIEVEAIRPAKCRYKSAVEPFIYSKMSPENREQMQSLIDSYWGTISQQVAQSRGISGSEMTQLTNNLDALFAQSALSAGLVDSLIYRDGLKDVYSRWGVVADDKREFNTITLGSYAQLQSKATPSGGNCIAIIYAEGSIYQGSGSSDGVYSEALISLIRRAKRDDDVKSVVLRVNSPGGDALAADVMWRELELLRQQKPLIVSMGASAASGGYYIAAPADVIVADRTTITGSIGVFGMLPYLGGALKGKLGITSESVKSGDMSDFASPLKPLSQSEKRILQRRVDIIYDKFLDVVVQGRNLPIERVMELAQGRVWSGEQALELGLIDAIGGLNEAVSIAADKAAITNFSIKEITHTPEGLDALLMFAQTQALSIVKSRERSELKELYLDYQRVQETLAPIVNDHNMVMYSPYTLEL